MHKGTCKTTKIQNVNHFCAPFSIEKAWWHMKVLTASFAFSSTLMMIYSKVTLPENRLNIHELTLLSKLTSGLSIHHELKQPVFMTYLQNQYMGISSKRKVMLIDKYSTFVLQFAIRLLSSTVFVSLEFSLFLNFWIHQNKLEKRRKYVLKFINFPI